jgi:hypothetical protein
VDDRPGVEKPRRVDREREAPAHDGHPSLELVPRQVDAVSEERRERRFDTAIRDEPVRIPRLDSGAVEETGVR